MVVGSRMLEVAYVAWRSSLLGLRAVGLAVLAAIPTLIVLAIVGSGAPLPTASRAAEALFPTLTLRVVTVLTVLVVGVGLFRSEIELDTLTYLTTRSVRRASIAVGKYLGGFGATAVFLVPAALAPLAVATAAGAPAPPAVVPETLVAVVLLACAAYGGFFLLLGLVSRSALVLGLIYGFLWEELILLLPGQFPKLTVLYYLLSYTSLEVTAGPLSGFATVVTPATAIAVPLAVAVTWVVLTAGLVRYVETAPERISA